ncbi:MAG: cytidine/deoxycytidylate deaminase family protein [Candidatus Desulfofervidaceae bacterium]|nr:cytidine/deoxycytidylate deaminase family protein [Candidatus Desulfofervidaceae bacterium]MDL1970107.1 cytidine/deoxycytidylate deaminase family protein [Candidatus Desulfofervidaceae bacterium]
MSRPSWDEYFMSIAYLVAGRSTCLRRKVGAVLVKNKRILATGYNGAPSGLAHCLDIGCLREKMQIPSGERHELCRAVHAEQNCLCQAARYGIPVEGAVIYCTNFPCVICAKMLINAGIKKIYYAEGYPDELSQEMLKEAGIELVPLPFKRKL